MRMLLWSSIAAVLALTGCRSAPTVHGAVDAGTRSAIEARNREMEAHFRADELGDLAAIYADDAVLYGPGGYRVEGREAIDAYWARFDDPLDWTLDVLGLEGGDDLVVQRGRSTLVRGREGGAKASSVVEFMLVWCRDDDGHWRIAVDAYWPTK